MRDNNKVNSHTDRILASEIDSFFSESQDVSKRALRKEAKEKRKAAKSKKKSPFVIEVVERKDVFDDIDDLLEQKDADIEPEESLVSEENVSAEVNLSVEDNLVAEDDLAVEEDLIKNENQTVEENAVEEDLAVEEGAAKEELDKEENLDLPENMSVEDNTVAENKAEMDEKAALEDDDSEVVESKADIAKETAMTPASSINDTDDDIYNVEDIVDSDKVEKTIDAEIEEEPIKTSKKSAKSSNRSIDDKREQKRLARRKRRRRNRIIAFVALLIFMLVIVGGSFFGVSYAINKHNERVEAEAIVEAAIEAALEEEEPILEIEMTPDEVEEEVEEPEIIEEKSDEELLDEMVRTMIEQMPLEDKVAGLFILSPELLTGQGNVTKAGEGTQNALEKYPIGGIVYDKQNIKSSEQLAEMIGNSISYNRYPMFIGISENGGSESQLSVLKVEKTMTPKELGAEGNSSAAFDTYNTVGTYLRENGFNFDLGLSADIMTNGVNTSFGDDATNVGAMVSGSLGGLKEASVYTCVRNFPGQGHVDGDPRKTLTSTSRTRAEMESEELLPFKAAIEAGTDMIMVGHFSAPELTGDNIPCSLSKAVMTDLLRNDMGYDGIIIPDVCNAESISQYYGADEIAIKALKAGADMILMPENFELAYDGVIAAVHDGTIDERRIDDSLARVYKVKYRDALSN